MHVRTGGEEGEGKVAKRNVSGRRDVSALLEYEGGPLPLISLAPMRDGAAAEARLDDAVYRRSCNAAYLRKASTEIALACAEK